MPPKYPKKGLASYLAPFILIILLIASAGYIIKNNVNLDDIKRVFKSPEIAKDEKVKIIYEKGSTEIKKWNNKNWTRPDKEKNYLEAGNSLRTDKGSILVLKFFEESEIRMNEKTEIKIIELEKDTDAGNHIAIMLVSGQIWGRIMKGNTKDADFIINTNNQLIQVSDKTLIDVKMNPETTRVIGGDITINVAEKINGTRKPISRVNLKGGQQITFDQLNIDQLKTGGNDISTSIDKQYLDSEWYIWNIDKEEKLGNILEIKNLKEKKLDKITDGLVTITSHKEGDTVGAKILLQGNYDNEKIESIYVNGVSAILGLSGEWEIAVPLSKNKNVLRVTAVEKNSKDKKEVKSITLKVDDEGPTLGKIVKPEVDENDNGVIIGEKLELIGEVSSDAKQVCISHNGADPYCLKQFKSGDNTYRYLGSISYKNVKKGKNKYKITVTDSLGNKSEKVIYLFQGEGKPSSRIIEEKNEETSSNKSSINTPIITDPDPNKTIEVTEANIKISGTVDKRSRSLLINGKKAQYEIGSGIFEIMLDLELGENLIKVQSTDSQGNKSKTAILKVIYLEAIQIKNQDITE